MRNDSMHIRDYREGDDDQIWNLHNEALNAVDAHAGNGPWDEDLKDIATAYMEAGGAFKVIEQNGTIIGMGALKALGDGTFEVKRMRIAPVLQGRGLGKRLLQALEEAGENLGARRFVLDTTTVQTVAQRMYETAGYRRIGTDKVGRFDVLVYEMRLE
ncbi:MAG: GNAT family N-acetyltransferase [Pseudomonadales bacterium]|nr:GNAT family N-acetyltransferase [Pseudomonadales bacterium]